MAAPFTDDFNNRRNWWEELEGWSTPTYQMFPGPTLGPVPWVSPQMLPSEPAKHEPVIDGYPSWVDPRVLPIFPDSAPQHINSAPSGFGPVYF
jgi:hypothetical protein